MINLDLLAEIPELRTEDPPALKIFANNIGDVNKLWRLADEKFPNFFYLRRDKAGVLKEGSISLVDLFQLIFQLNKNINEFDLFFWYMVIYRRKKDLTDKKVRKEILRQSSLYLEPQEVVNKIRSTPSFLDLLQEISITEGNTNFLPFGQHWDLIYVSPEFDSNKKLIDMLMSCSKLKTFENKEEYLDYIFQLDVNVNVVDLAVN